MTANIDLGEHEADYDLVRRSEGLLVGMLDDAEIAAFDRLVKAGLAERHYQGATGFLGLAKVHVRRWA